MTESHFPPRDERSSRSAVARKKRLTIALSAVFILALVMAVGPGIQLVNRPVPFLGLPLVYAWGLLWYVVQVGVVLLLYFFVWTDDAET